jgi:archaellin
MLEMGRERFINQDFEYFDITVDPAEGKEVIDLQEDTVAIVQNDRVRLNQLDVFAKSEFDYQTVYLDKQAIIDLAEYLKNN